MNKYRIRIDTKCFSVLDKIKKIGIGVFDVESQDNTMEFNIFASDKNKLFQELQKINITPKILKSFGVIALAENLYKHIGLLVGLMLSIIIIVIVNSYAVVLEVSGAENAQIEKVLMNNGIKFNFKKKNISLDSIEKIIFENIDNVAFCSAQYSGAKLIINVLPALKNEKPVELKNNIISGYDAVVTRVIVSSGTQMIKSGDRVLKNQELISGNIIIDKDPYDDKLEGEEVKVGALGQVYGKVWYKEQILLQDGAKYLIRTEKKQSYKKITIFGRTFGKDKSAEFDKCETEIKVKKNNFIFPYSIKTTTYFELQEMSYNIEEIKNQEIFNAKRKILEEMPIGASILRDWHYETKINDSTIIDIYYEVEQRIDI